MPVEGLPSRGLIVTFTRADLSLPDVALDPRRHSKSLTIRGAEHLLDFGLRGEGARALSRQNGRNHTGCGGRVGLSGRRSRFTPLSCQRKIPPSPSAMSGPITFSM